jgi:hypothetical protein
MMSQSTSISPFRRRAHGPPACCSIGFLRRESAILKACAAGSGNRAGRRGLLRRECECCCRNGSGPLRRERASGVGTRRQRRAITTRVSDVRKKTTLGGNQRKRVLRNERIQLGHQQRRHILRNMCRQYESYQ